MTYPEFVDMVFSEHHNCMGLDEEEIQNIIDESTLLQRERWLIRIGYDLHYDFHANEKATHI